MGITLKMTFFRSFFDRVRKMLRNPALKDFWYVLWKTDLIKTGLLKNMKIGYI